MPNVQQILTKLRPPRIQITYDVETEGAVVEKQLPFVVGIMGDYSGNMPYIQKEAYKDRQFVEIDPDNFNEVLAKQGPGLTYSVDNTLAGDGSEMGVNLKFADMDDFDPYNVAMQIEPLAKLLTARERLSELMVKADQYSSLEALLEEVLQNPSDIQAISKKLGPEPTDNNAASTSTKGAKSSKASAKGSKGSGSTGSSKKS